MNDYFILKSNSKIKEINLKDLVQDMDTLAQTKELFAITPETIEIIAKAKRYENQSIVTCLQYFANAFMIETDILALNSTKLQFETDDHYAITGKSGQDKPDFIGNKSNNSLEVKIYNPKSKINMDFHNADFILLFNVASSSWEAGKKGPNGYITIDPAALNLTLPKTVNLFFINVVKEGLYSISKRAFTVETEPTKNNTKNTIGSEDSRVLRSDNGELPDEENDDPRTWRYENFKESHGNYSNNLDLTKALENKEECIELIRNKYGHYGPIKTGGFYIMPDGTAVESVNHADIDKFLIRTGYIEGKVEDYGDGSQFMEAINCVRLRRRGGRDSWILPYMILPKNQLTQMQYNIVSEWVDFVMKNSGSLSVQTMTGDCKNYNSSYFPEDIMADIHNYYRYHFFEDYESMFEPKIDQTDYQLQHNLTKGFFDQFDDELLYESDDSESYFTVIPYCGTEQWVKEVFKALDFKKNRQALKVYEQVMAEVENRPIQELYDTETVKILQSTSKNAAEIKWNIKNVQYRIYCFREKTKLYLMVPFIKNSGDKDTDAAGILARKRFISIS